MKQLLSSVLAACMMFSISAVGVHAATPAEVKTKEKVVNLEDAKIVSQSPKVDLPSDNPNIKKYQVTTIYDNGIRTVDVMIDEKLLSLSSNNSIGTMLTATNYKNRVRLENDRRVYPRGGSTLLAYVRAVGVFQYTPAVTGAITIHDTYGSGVTKKSSLISSYTSNISTAYKQYHCYAYVNVKYTLKGGIFPSGTIDDNIQIGCDIYGNRL